MSFTYITLWFYTCWIENVNCKWDRQTISVTIVYIYRFWFLSIWLCNDLLTNALNSIRWMCMCETALSSLHRSFILVFSTLLSASTTKKNEWAIVRCWSAFHLSSLSGTRHILMWHQSFGRLTINNSFLSLSLSLFSFQWTLVKWNDYFRLKMKSMSIQLLLFLFLHFLCK